jgi:hypothetical protein
MSGKPGRVPKHSSQRRRRNLDGRPEQVEVPGPPVEVPALRPGIHPLAAAWYQSLIDSDQSRYYQPSDWVIAQVVAEAIEDYAHNRKVSTLQAILSGATSLLATEGDRRRLRLELTRKVADTDEAAAVVAIAEYQSRLGS